MKQVDIPRHVDSQHQVFFWEIDEFLPVFVMFGVGIMLDALLWVMVPTMLLVKLMAVYKHQHNEGVLIHLTYWLGIAPLNKQFTNGQERIYEP